MEVKDNDAFKQEVQHTIGMFLGTEYAARICDAIIDDVRNDVECCSDEEYNGSDIILAIGRTLVNKLNPENGETK